MAKRRGHGEGSIYERNDGRWCGSVMIGRDASGKIKRRYVYGKTRKEVATALSDILVDMQKGLPVDACKHTVADFLNRWLEDVAKLSWRPGTIERHESAIRRHIIPAVGNVKLNKLSPQHLQKLCRDLSASGFTTTVRLAHAVMHAALEQAVKWNLIARNPAGLVDKPKVPRKKATPLNPGQVVTFLEVAEGDRLHALYVLAALCGLREAELFGLRWGDVDLESGILSVRQQLQHLSKKQMEDPFIDNKVSEWIDKSRGWALMDLKSAKGLRTVALSTDAVSALRKHRARQAEERLAAGSKWRDLGLVFCTEIGTPLQKNNLLERSYKPLLRRAGLPEIRFHDLRHSHVSLLIEAGAELKDIQGAVGHSSITLTADTYGHLFLSRKRQMMTKLDETLDAVRAKGRRGRSSRA